MRRIGQEEGSKAWDDLKTPIYKVIDDEGENMMGALVRRRLPYYGSWLYVDECDGYQTMTTKEVGYLNLVRQT